VNPGSRTIHTVGPVLFSQQPPQREADKTVHPKRTARRFGASRENVFSGGCGMNRVSQE
jgi:hypothetical protein